MARRAKDPYQERLTPKESRMSAAVPLVRIESLVKQYTRDTQTLTVLDKVSLTVDEGDFVALMGPSGSGKTTLLNLIAGIDRPTSGRIVVGDREVSTMSEAALAKWRSANVGFIFQLYNLVRSEERRVGKEC